MERAATRGPTFIMTPTSFVPLPTSFVPLNDTNDLPLPNLRALIDHHGTFAVGFAYLRAALMRKPRPPDDLAEMLSDHLLRDIGLTPGTPEARLCRRAGICKAQSLLRNYLCDVMALRAGG